MTFEGGKTLPTRRLIRIDVRPAFDEHGFLAEEFCAAAPRVDSLFDRHAVLVVAPPWSGKTYLAGQLYRYLSDTAEGPDRSLFGRNVHATLFEQQGAATDPPWWAAWQDGTDRACWIVDALDEDARGRLKQMHGILDRIEALPNPTRDRLLLLMLARENEMPEDIRSRVEKTYGKPGGGDDGKFLILRLAPVDASIAKQIVGAGSTVFDKVCTLIKQNRLESIAALPVVLEYLARQPADTKATTADVWRGVLKNLLRDMRRERTDTMALTPIDERFTATCRVAAALTFSGRREVDSGLGQSDAPGVEDLFPLGSTSEALRQPAREALRSAIFQRMGAYYRLAQFHVQEWFTAFGLQDVRLSRLLPLVADGEGKPFKHYQGVLGLLHKVTRHPDEVAEWIVEAHGGIPPRSDAAPLTLEDAKAALNRLLEVAKTTPYLSPPEGLKNLDAPGLSLALAEMMSDKGRTLSERELLIDVAQAIAANETALAAQAIILDGNEDDHLRYSAAFLLHQVGAADHLRQVERFVEDASPATQYQRAMISVLIESLRGRGLWSLVKAAQYLPERDEHLVDSTAMLEYHLENEMTLEDARAILRAIDWDALTCGDQDERTRQRRRRPARGTRNKLIVKAIELAAQQEHPTADDYTLLLPIALDERRTDWLRLERLNLASVFKKDMEARRKLFMAGLKRDPEAKQPGWWSWRWVLTEEDLDWLAGLCPSQARESPWLWADLLALAYRPSLPRKKRNEIRISVEAAVPHVLAEFSANRRKYLAQERARKLREDKARQKQESRQYSLGEIVNDTLNNPRIRLRDQVLRLGWFCFVEKSFRPNNVLGEWGDLDSNLRRTVLDVCEKALAECEPTPIPKSDPYPGAILYEAAVFTEVIKQSPTYEPDADQIRKWLPAALKAGTPIEEAVLARCLLADREVAEDVLLDKIKREMASESGSFTAGGLSKEHWSARLSRKAVDFIKDESLNLKARGELLRLMAEGAPSLVAPIAQEWSSTPPGESEALRLKRTAGLDALLIIDPSVAVPQLVARYEKEGKTLLADLSTLANRFPSEGVKSASWATPLIEGLVDVLYKAYPPEADPQYAGAHSVGPDDELRWLRDGLINTLFQRQQPEDQEALKRLAGRHPRLGRWYENVQASLAAQHVVQYLVPPDGPEVAIEGRVPVKEVVRLMEDALYRLVRSESDLQRVLWEELREIEKTAKCHLPMLYRPASKGKPRTRLNEEALQAYIHCRLRDRLPNRVLGQESQLFLDREPLAGMNQRLDIKVQAPTVTGGRATVVVEVKWSDNDDVSSSLGDQLGKKYLLGQGLTHGIYLVGWYRNRTWAGNPMGIRPARPYSVQSWTDALKSQTRRFGTDSPGIKIEPFVMDLTWD
jgi:hypothetical protein